MLTIADYSTMPEWPSWLWLALAATWLGARVLRRAR